MTQQLPVTGVIPVVQPDGKLVLTFWSGRTGMVSVTSTDGGVTLDAPVVISRADDAGRAPVPRAAADRGRARAERLRADRVAGLPLPDGLHGERRRHLALGRREDVDRRRCASPPGRNVVLPTIGVEPGTGRLAIAYYVIQRNGIDAELITSADGTRWSAPQRLNARRMPLEWMPQTTLGRMLADYIGVSWVRGRPLVVLALASPPRGGELRQAIYAVRG